MKKMQMGMEISDGSMMKDSMMKKGGSSTSKTPKMAKGGAAGTALKNALIKGGYKKGGSTKK